MTLFRYTLIAMLTAAILPHSAFAAGSESEPAVDVTECEEGQIFDKETEECVAEEDTSMNDGDRLDNGRALAYAERFDEAIAILSKIENRNAEVLNYLGYATRNAGNVEKGLQYYQAALALDPDYTLARSYMGQALLKQDDRRGALIQLVEIRNRAGTEAREYKMLALALEAEGPLTARY